MKKNLRLACLFFLIFYLITVGFVNMASAGAASSNDNYSYSKVEDPSKLGKDKLPTTEYPIWGYKDKNYTFSIDYTISPNNYSNTTIVFYWDCLKNGSNYYPFVLSDPEKDTGDSTNKTAWKRNNQTWCCRHKWNEIGNYSVAVGIFKLNSSKKPPTWDGEKVSFWIPVEIKNNTTIEVQNIFMMDEKKGFDGDDLAKLYNNTYCGYVDNGYSFSVKINATSNEEADNRTINETTTVIYWDYGNNQVNESDNSILGNKSDEKVIQAKNVSDKNMPYITWDENFTHEWDEEGKKSISATAFHWDPLDGSEMYSEHNNTSILIIRDPKHFIPDDSIIGSVSNLHNWGILLSIVGLIMFFFTYTRNNVPVKISLFGMKPFYLRSVNSFTGTLTFVTGMYLYFVFGRCPWDIPIVSGLDGLSEAYFNYVLYSEYKTPGLHIPYLSILLGLIDIITLSLVIHLIAIPLYKGELKFEKLSRIKSSSASAQPQQGSYPIEETKHYDN
jgi:hypothetical protein